MAVTTAGRVARIDSQIVILRNARVILDESLARAYGVPTGALNQAVKRNQFRFPADFAFQLTRGEWAALKSQIVISNDGRGGRRTRPWVFTEHGAIMAASVLNSRQAVETSVFVVRAFVRLRELGSPEFVAKLSAIEKKVCAHDAALREVFQAFRKLLAAPGPKSRRIGYRP